MIKQLILELNNNNEIQAAKELAIAYLKHEKDFEVINVLSKIFYDENQFDKALECLEYFGDIPEAQLNKAKCLYYLKRAPEAENLILSLSEEYLKNPLVQIDLCLYLTAQGKFEQSKNILKNLAHEYPQAAFNYGWFLLGEDKFQEGYSYIRKGVDLRVWGHEWLLKENGIDFSKLWNGENVDTIAYYLEGGMGDEIIFIRYTNHFLKYCKTLKIFCTKSIKPLLESCGYDNAYVHDDFYKETWDKFVPAMSAPYFLKLSHPCEGIEFPYLKRTSKPVEEMNRIAMGEKKICIKWKGNPNFEHDQFRSVPVEKLLNLSKYGQVFSIQLEDINLPKNADVWDLSHLIKTWEDTYDIFSESDLVVTSCTSTAHLAGAMGAKVLVLVPLVPYFTWASENTNWYSNNVLILRQEEYNCWDKTIEKMYKILDQEFNK